jgi:hypothetical protein
MKMRKGGKKSKLKGDMHGDKLGVGKSKGPGGGGKKSY